MNDVELVFWDCPACGAGNIDPQNKRAYCIFCGEAVFVNEDENHVDDLHYKVEVLNG